MRYSLDQLVSILKADFVGDTGLGEFIVRHIIIDSRKVKGGEEAVFWALKGPRNNGHQFMHDAYLMGIRCFVVSEPEFIPESWKDAAFLIVDDGVSALQRLAIFHRQRFDIPTIGITGSNGKTIVKEWLYRLIGTDINVAKSPKSYNSQIGVPLSVLGLDSQHQLGIFEAGISQPGEMEQLTPIIDPAVVIMTNIGPPHDAGFESREQKLREKLKLTKHTASIIYCRDHQMIHDAIGADERAVSWGASADAHFPVKTKRSGNHTMLIFSDGDKDLEFRVPFTDRASIENVCHCITALILLDYDIDTVRHRVLELKNVPMRLEMKYGANNCTLIDDTYSADIDSLKIALEFLDEQPSMKTRTLIISEFKESMLEADVFIRQVIQLAQAYSIDKVVGVGRAFKEHHTDMTVNGFEFRAYDSTEALLEHTGYDSFNSELILIKGARAFEFERVVARLQLQSHRTVLEINLNALVNNFNLYRKFIKEETGVIAMVKAFSYGAGSVEIASVLEKQGVQALAVAYVDEGVKLRKLGIRCPIMVMNASYDDLSLLLNYKLEPEVYSIDMLREISGRFQSGSFGDEKLGIHIKLDTGMNRLGISSAEVDEFVTVVQDSNNLLVKSIFSHLAASEDAIFDKFTFEQLQLFKKVSEDVLDKFYYEIKRHILNSAGIIRFTGAQYDWVRLGLGMYGVDTTSSIQERLEAVGTLKTRIIQVKRVPKGETIGYGRKGQALNDMKIAILPIGYADGLDRRLSNGKGEVFLKGKKARTVGNICMDLTMIDVTAIDNPQPGDEVEIFGKNVSVVDAAARIGTIPYELLTNIPERVKRIYVKD